MLTDRRYRNLAVRLLLIVAATISVSLDAPTALNTTLVALAFIATAGTLVRSRQLGWADAVAVASAGLLVVLVVVGFALDALPSGLTRVAWALGAGLVAVAAVLYGQLKPAADALPSVDSRTVLRVAPWYAAAAVLVVVAIATSVHATRIANRAPLALSSTGTVSAGHVVVKIFGGRKSGQYDLVVTGSGDGTAHTYGPLTVTAGRTLRSTVSVTAGVRTQIVLRQSGTTKTLRSLTVGGAPTPTSGS